MFYFVLTVCVLHLLWMNWLIYYQADIFICLLSAIAPIALNCCMPSAVIFFESLAMVALVVLHRWLFPKRRLGYLASSLCVAVAIFALTAWHALSVQNELMERFPMESMANRVPTPRRGTLIAPVAADPDRKEWTLLQKLIECDIEEHRHYRSAQLKRLHEETTQNFVQSPGFGVTRGMAGNVNPDRLEFRSETDLPVQPMEVMEPLVFSTQALEKPYQGNQRDVLSELHFGGLRDFVNVQGFGYVKDRQHVAGFYPHQFSKMPTAMSVRVKRLELVSLLMHKEPRVYVTKELPRMKEIKKAPTRGISDFEAMGLESLGNGDDLFVREIDATILMLGVIRSIEQCVTCHGGERGDLLGAFSYTLIRFPNERNQ